jgi:hypothetical protein
MVQVAQVGKVAGYTVGIKAQTGWFPSPIFVKSTRLGFSSF